MPYSRSLAERITHATLFELGGVLLVAPPASWLMGVPMLHMGALAVWLSTTALLWSMAFNAGFDALLRRRGLARTWAVRIAHALLFEGGFILIAVPIAAAWLNIGLLQAFALDIGLFLFYLPYTFLYNLGYDTARRRLVGQS
ncbi:multidrug/biocide efflux PACE transporter [Paludibacterium paludis]|uniref:Membrane protein n=1 Tax=Paludibacterium paludis TaxID=1225769 RepID=A0A918U9Q5_9NEIS|nr:multidrug/biocide efflux PACE transporter [Paludibacterium paludis]GGY17238.1 membrane protein [Paludibacterium paludis]